jgi:hypothetical protein
MGYARNFDSGQFGLVPVNPNDGTTLSDPRSALYQRAQARVDLAREDAEWERYCEMRDDRDYDEHGDPVD